MKIIITESQLNHILKEALPLSVGKKYSSIHRDENVLKNIDDIFNKIKSKYPESKTSKRGDRLFIPFINDIYSVKSEVESVLSKKNIKIKDYKQGIAVEPKYNRDIKIGKVLNSMGEKELMDKYAKDISKINNNSSKRFVVISKHPYDVAGMSTDRDWDSCMNINHGINRNYVEKDIELGTLIGYEISSDDTNINNPMGRVLIKPYSSKDGKILYKLCKREYGKVSESFINKINEIFYNLDFEEDEYHLSNELYSDLDNVTINYKKINYVNRFAKVQNNDGKYNFIDKNKKLISKMWFNSAEDFDDGFAHVNSMINGDYLSNYLNSNGKLVSKIWYELAYGLNSDKCFIIYDNGKFNIMNSSGRTLSDIWFDNVYQNNDNTFDIRMGKLMNFMDSNGNKLSREWFEFAYKINDDLYKITKEGKYNLLSKKNNILSDVWFDYLSRYEKKDLNDLLFEVKLNNKYNIINSNGNYISNIWFDNILVVTNKTITGYIDGKFQEINWV